MAEDCQDCWRGIDGDSFGRGWIFGGIFWEGRREQMVFGRVFDCLNCDFWDLGMGCDLRVV